MLKILAGADVHLGMKFAGYPEVRQDLAEARFTALERLVQAANESDCDMVVLAGDLFDRVSVAARDVVRAAELLNRFHGRLVTVLPGNHDFHSGTAGSLWSRFADAAGDRILVLQDPRIYDLNHFDLEVLLFAGPCDSKHGRNSAISWMEEGQPRGEQSDGDPQTLRIGVAHGSIEAISPDAQGVYFPMTREQLAKAPVDLWIIGHTHRQHPAEAGGVRTDRNSPPPVLIPGTPEPDGFDCTHGGTAWLIEVEEKGRVRLDTLSTGTYRFVREERTLANAAEVRRFTEGLESARQREQTLLRLTLQGRLEAEQLRELRRVLAEAGQSYFYTRIDGRGLLERIGERTVEAEFTQGSFPYRLLKALIAEKDYEALQTAYNLLQGQRQ
jgi:DNA repair exonuclease SbcCD nuclease subunit